MRVMPAAGASLKPEEAMSKYTFYIVSRSADDHYPVLLANNGKVPFNESVTRANKLKKSIENFLTAVHDSDVAVVHTTHDAFKKKYPRFAKNAKRGKR